MSKKHEGVYFVPNDLLDVYSKQEEEGYWTSVTLRGLLSTQPADCNVCEKCNPANDMDCLFKFDALDTREYHDMQISSLTRELGQRFPSFSSPEGIWRRNGEKIILQNNFFDIAIIHADGYMAVALLEREGGFDDSSYNLMGKHVASYLKGIRETLIDLFGECYGYGGAWSFGKKYAKIAREVS